MDIHPVIVHFPVALITLYALSEILPISKWLPSINTTSLKTLLLIFGSLGAIAAIFTGSIAEDLISDPDTRKIISIHETFAYLTTYIFCTILLARLISWFFVKYPELSNSRFSFFRSAANFILSRWVVIALSVLGLISIITTGALGGIIVYGPTTDPFTKTIHSLLIK